MIILVVVVHTRYPYSVFRLLYCKHYRFSVVQFVFIAAGSAFGVLFVRKIERRKNICNFCIHTYLLNHMGSFRIFRRLCIDEMHCEHMVCSYTSFYFLFRWNYLKSRVKLMVLAIIFGWMRQLYTDHFILLLLLR